MESKNTISSLEKKRRRLYATKEKIEAPSRILRNEKSIDIPHKWKRDSAQPPHKRHRHVRFATVFFLVAVSFFVIALGTASYIFMSGGRSVSTNNVIITMQGPTTIAGGDTVSLLVSVTNKNPVEMKNTNLSLEFPAGTRNASNVSKSITHDEENFGTIAPGEHVERTIKVVLFGGQGDIVTIPASLQFQTSGSNAILIKNTSYTLSIVATPLSVSVDMPSETTPDQPFSMIATVRSNATTPLTNVALRVNYPTGFTPTKTSLKPIGSMFLLGTLSPGQTTVVRITGRLSGQDSEKRVFRFVVGTTDKSKAAIAIAYMTQSATLTITQPFLATTLSVNGNTSNHIVVSAEAPIHATLSWKNTLNVPITNARIEVKLSGAPFSQDVQIVGGQYQSSNKTIVFSRDSDPSFATLAPNAQGTGNFTITPQISNATSSASIVNPSIVITVSVSGQRLGSNNVAQSISSTVTKTLKIATNLSLDAYTLYSTGPFTNSGPVPPRANETTTYTIMWNVHNTTNDVAGATVSANLPAYVQFVGQVSPKDGSILYDSGAHTVTWTVGNISANTTHIGSFQVSVIPSTSQHGTAPVLVNKPMLTGFDRFAQVSVSAMSNNITTNLSHDPSHQQNGDGNVQ